MQLLGDLKCIQYVSVVIGFSETRGSCHLTQIILVDGRKMNLFLFPSFYSFIFPISCFSFFYFICVNSLVVLSAFIW